MLLPIILYPPFIFATIFPPQIRVVSYLLLNLYLFFYHKRYFKYDLYIFCILIFLSIIMVSRNVTGTTGLFTTGNYLLTVFFGWGLYRYLYTSTYNYKILISLYIKFMTLVPIFSLLSVLFMITFGELNLFDLPFVKYNILGQAVSYDYKITPFGLLLVKTFGDFKVYRSFFFWYEPVYASIFYAANIIFIVPYMKNNSRLFFITNVIGGVLTYSYAFYILLIVLYITKQLKMHFSITSMWILLFIAIFHQVIIDIFLYSSFSDRLYRFELFIKSFETSNTIEMLFGHGVHAPNGHDRAFSSGFLTSIFEIGIIGTALELMILIILIPYYKIILFFLITAAVIDPIKLPLFMFLIFVLSHTFDSTSVHKAPKLGKSVV
jgi:hypothetical protein